MIDFDITVLVAVYNDKNEIATTLESIFAQTFKKYQVIIIDGLSSDGTVDVIVQKYTFDQNEKILISEKDRGVYDALNKGVLRAAGKYLIVMNSGDCFNDEFALENLYQYATKDGSAFVIGRVLYKKNNGTKADNPSTPKDGAPEVSHQALLYKRRLHDRLGLYDVKYKSAADYDFFWKLKRHFEVSRFVKQNVYVAIRDKRGSKQLSDSIGHSLEMIAIDLKYKASFTTLGRRLSTLVKKIISKVFI